jgi:hypothetical protein
MPKTRRKRDVFEEHAQAIDDAEQAVFAGQPVSEDFWEISPGIRATDLVERGRGGAWKIGDPHSVYSLLGHRHQLPKERPRFGLMLLATRGRPKDVLLSAPIRGYGLVLSARAREVFATVELGRYGAYPLKVAGPDPAAITYFWLQVANDATSRIDFAKSEFLDADMWITRKTSKVIRVANRAEFKRVDKRLLYSDRHFRIKDVVLRSAPADLFFVQPDLTLFATARLKQAVEAARLTGFSFTPTRRLRLATASR